MTTDVVHAIWAGRSPRRRSRCWPGAPARSVLERGSIVGIITERDLLRAIAEGRPLALAKVLRYMAPSPVTVDGTADARLAAGLMRKHRIRHLAVEEGGGLAGLLSTHDLLTLSPWPGRVPIAEPW